MPQQAYRYVLCRPVPFPEVMSTFDLALIAVQSLHGDERTRLDARLLGCLRRFGAGGLGGGGFGLLKGHFG